MKRSRFTEQQIIAVLRPAESGTAVEDWYRRAGISTVKFYKGEGEVRGHANQRNASLRLLGEENGRPKEIVAQRFKCRD